MNKAVSDNRFKFIFRGYAVSSLPPRRSVGVPATLEAYESDVESAYPLGTAYLSIFTAKPKPAFPAILDFILVPDHRRRQGAATALLLECRRRWPGIYITGAISDEGHQLLVSVGEL